MKKIVLLIAALVAAAACAAPTTNRDVASTTNSNKAAEAPAPMTEADAIAKEKAIWDTIKRKDYDAFTAMLDVGSQEVTPQGVLPKEGSVSSVKDFEPSEVNFSDWKFISIDKDAFIVTYAVAVKGKFRGKEFPEDKARASSAWVSHDGKWLAMFHQECPAKPAPTPAPAQKSTPATAATPATSPAPPPVTTSDAIANEKLVWDLFKAKNFDAFATLLAPEFTEIEPDGVYDRAGTVKGVQSVEISKAVLSEWKATNINDDAMLVTYVVKGPGPWDPMGERHSTIWVKRDGKWLGILHHGGTGVRAAPAPTPTPKTAVSPAK
jgi:hypothetical protein